ncbi:cysteine hydrolase family protein [Paenibacillus farraposensis]|uniref:Cysteine hydrolase family protein n=1 Tax=Paenibacillus farraposensis TaxID=2807095 RepID=A0ABW4DF62_9BACL|nr:cysteine hydrolase family protein [Paenibacillus farraposensis]MCC3382021.1 cysteine hydrolase [Paenibacillus farraposensis]
MGQNVLLMIDVQQAMFMYDEKLYREQEVVANLQQILAKARAAGTPVIFVQHTDETDEDYRENSAGWAISGVVHPLPHERVVRKTSWDSFYQIELLHVFEEIGADQLVIAGMQTEFCLDTTCRSAYGLGYQNHVLVSDAHSTFDNKVLSGEQIVAHHNAVLGNRFVRLLAAADVHFA